VLLEGSATLVGCALVRGYSSNRQLFGVAGMSGKVKELNLAKGIAKWRWLRAPGSLKRLNLCFSLQEHVSNQLPFCRHGFIATSCPDLTRRENK